MDFYGNINLRENEMRSMVMQIESEFPITPIIGRVVFKAGRLYICADISGGIPAWVPLTNASNTYIHDQSTASDTWTITHNLNSTNPLVQIYDDDLEMQIPEKVVPITNNQIEITLGTAIVGRAILMHGTEPGAFGGIMMPERAFIWEQDTPATIWVVRHKLGYNPTVTVYDSLGDEIIPQNIQHDDIFQTTITFSGNQTGSAKFV